MDGIGDESIGFRDHGFEKYGGRLIASSVGLGKSGLSAALLSHGRGVTEYKDTEPEAEICVVISPSNSLVTRLSGGVVDRAIAERGSVRECFGDADPDRRWQAAGRNAAVSLAARLVHSHSGLSPDKDLEQRSHQGLDRRRLARVRDYIDANLEGGNLTIARLAKVACLSRFHFARAFKAAVGNSPHKYVSEHRLERAKKLLTREDQSLLDIAVALNFSSQANFTRAFRNGTGVTPGQYRRGQLVARPLRDAPSDAQPDY
jgi:AraC-like DNA-binding protein